MSSIDFANSLLSLLTIASEVLAVALIFSWLFFRSRPESAPYKFLQFVAVRKGVWLAFVVTLFAMFGSLFYSEIAGYEPCKLCWFQRILMYPQVFLLGLALIRKENFIRVYSLLLSVIGAVIAAYHYYLQLGGNPLIPCSTVGYSVTCSQKFVLQFGYITIPMMALSAFILIVVLFAVAFNLEKRNSVGANL